MAPEATGVALPPGGLTGSPALRRLLEAHGIRPTSALGQNFVVDANTLRKMVRLAEVGPGQAVLEVGAGLGSLTVALAAAGAKVVAVEIDRRLAELAAGHTATLPVEVLTADALALSWSEVVAAGERLGVAHSVTDWLLVANLPYNVATPLVLRVLQEFPAVRALVVMVQREVGERLAASVGDPAYGAVSLKVAYHATAEVVARVPPSVFVPRPKVDSVVVALERRGAPAVDPAVVSERRLFEVVGAGFAKRRKMLRGALAQVVAPGAFEAAGVDPTARAEQLDLAAFAALAAAPPAGEA
jgi:16S rRNA (adenine1518-N6/adenine1519-N6)-dimethyltransferase